jgi:hypothetical protein
MKIAEVLIILVIIIVVAVVAIMWVRKSYGVESGATVYIKNANGDGLAVDQTGVVHVTSSPTKLTLKQVIQGTKFLHEGAPFTLYDPATKKYLIVATVNGSCIVLTAPTSTSVWLFQNSNIKSDGTRVKPGTGYALSPGGPGTCLAGQAIQANLSVGAMPAEATCGQSSLPNSRGASDAP